MPELTTITPMRSRTAGQEVIAEFLRQQEFVPPRTPIARFLGRSPLGTESRPWYIGAEGEIAVGRELADLPAGWTVLHAVPIGTRGSDIDHIVIGPGGVFTVNTKHHLGKNIWVGRRAVMVNGRKVPYLRNAEYEATRVSTLITKRMPLGIDVQPLVVIVAPRQITIRQKPDRVTVLTSRQLRRWLEKRPSVLDEATVSALTALLDDPDVWGTGTPTRSDLGAEFHRLDAEVRTARTRRKLWAGAGVVGIGAALLGGLPLALQMYTEVVYSLMP
ncbi:nuclease-related domain-containing protein [Mycetocola zhadangensis]|uniref:NERD domain-containing protein n=1 Tax=Mycetocola zhadangensis TaxID=1164595 RepID=A0A3L7J0R9_9MICO|nr:nuclease-related domain-containing protein [Mycetocola zhadangensis]RLQ84096.1 NERD domain-containing protein [Mycetocola zhadangensis]GGE96202.1 hypothetical protein GCM10011313_18970 [Mycetocola zhadangensis]